MCFRSRSVGLRSEEVSQSSTSNLSSLFENSFLSNWNFCLSLLIYVSGELLFVGLASCVGLCLQFFKAFECGEAMREPIHTQGGQCGNQIDAKFWSIISN